MRNQRVRHSAWLGHREKPVFRARHESRAPPVVMTLLETTLLSPLGVYGSGSLGHVSPQENPAPTNPLLREKEGKVQADRQHKQPAAHNT